MERKRGGSDSGNQPAVQVVGFHVEGQSPSPRNPSILQDSMKKITSGSPVPVIIPPSFQAASTTAAAHKASTTEAAASGATSGGDAGTASATAAAAGDAAGSRPSGDATGGGAAAHSDRRSVLAVGTPLAPIPQDTAPAAGDATSTRLPPLPAAPTSPVQAPPAPPSAQSETSRQPGSHQPQQAQAQAQAGLQPQQQSQPQEPPQPRQPRQPPGGHEQPPPRKVLTRAERREIQEAQRAAKAAAKAGAAAADAPASGGASASAAPATASRSGGGGGGAAAAAATPPATTPASTSDAAAAAKQRGAAPAAGAGVSAPLPAPSPGSTLDLFSHLPQYRPLSVEDVLAGGGAAAGIHPAIVQLGLRYADGTITGGNARCLALVSALSQVIADYRTPEGKSLSRDLTATVNAAVDFLVRCRPLSVSMGAAIKALKVRISTVDPSAPEGAAKEELQAALHEWVTEKVVLADRVLVQHAVTKVYDGDVVLTYAYSSVVLEVLLQAAAAGRRFRVVVVDGRPELEGRHLLQRLLQADIPCAYAYLSALSYVMREVTKVLLGAAGVMSNGAVMARAGSAAVAMAASSSRLPVLVACEAYKFHERVQLDSITHNELGDPAALARLPPGAVASRGVPTGLGSLGQSAAGDGGAAAGGSPLAAWPAVGHGRLRLLNLKYDLMPADLVALVVTEFGMVPPTSVPVILREFSANAHGEA